jgi:hypothetical protein
VVLVVRDMHKRKAVVVAVVAAVADLQLGPRLWVFQDLLVVMVAVLQGLEAAAKIRLAEIIRVERVAQVELVYRQALLQVQHLQRQSALVVRVVIQAVAVRERLARLTREMVRQVRRLAVLRVGLLVVAVEYL